MRPLMMGWLLGWTAAVGLAVATPAAALAAAAVPADGKNADLILRHGVFYTVEAPARLAGSLAVKDGRIAYLGEDAGADAWKGPKTRVLELGGRAVTPGLIDAHSHL